MFEILNKLLADLFNTKPFDTEITEDEIKYSRSIINESNYVQKVEPIVEFKPWPKIKRDNPFTVTITEKMDGTKSCIIIKDDAIVGVQSRNRFITPEDDNFGFAMWVDVNTKELLKLGEGYHYGEWAGEGIQKNPHNIIGRKLFLFNTFRWNSENPNRPNCCDVVPILFQGQMDANTVQTLMADLLANKGDKETPEGIIVYYHTFRNYSKHTFKHSNGKWQKEKDIKGGDIC